MQDEEEDGATTSAAAQAATVPAAPKEVSKEGGKGKKRSGEDIIEREKERSKKAKEDATRKAEWFELKQNTSVYVSGLPSDVTEEELAQVRGCRRMPFVLMLLPVNLHSTLEMYNVHVLNAFSVQIVDVQLSLSSQVKHQCRPP